MSIYFNRFYIFKAYVLLGYAYSLLRVAYYLDKIVDKGTYSAVLCGYFSFWAVKKKTIYIADMDKWSHLFQKNAKSLLYVEENAYSKMRLRLLWINALSSIARSGNQTPWNPADLI